MMTIELKRYGAKAEQVQVSTLREAARKVRAFITEFDLGGETWQGGFVRVDGKKTYMVSYNGRVWVHTSLKGWTPETPEIVGRDLDIEY